MMDEAAMAASIAHLEERMRGISATLLLLQAEIKDHKEERKQLLKEIELLKGSHSEHQEKLVAEIQCSASKDRKIERLRFESQKSASLYEREISHLNNYVTELQETQKKLRSESKEVESDQVRKLKEEVQVLKTELNAKITHNKEMQNELRLYCRTNEYLQDSIRAFKSALKETRVCADEREEALLKENKQLTDELDRVKKSKEKLLNKEDTRHLAVIEEMATSHKELRRLRNQKVKDDTLIITLKADLKRSEKEIEKQKDKQNLMIRDIQTFAAKESNLKEEIEWLKKDKMHFSELISKKDQKIAQQAQKIHNLQRDEQCLLERLDMEKEKTKAIRAATLGKANELYRKKFKDITDKIELFRTLLEQFTTSMSCDIPTTSQSAESQDKLKLVNTLLKYGQDLLRDVNYEFRGFPATPVPKDSKTVQHETGAEEKTFAVSEQIETESNSCQDKAARNVTMHTNVLASSTSSTLIDKEVGTGKHTRSAAHDSLSEVPKETFVKQMNTDVKVRSSEVQNENTVTQIKSETVDISSEIPKVTTIIPTQTTSSEDSDESITTLNGMTYADIAKKPAAPRQGILKSTAKEELPTPLSPSSLSLLTLKDFVIEEKKVKFVHKKQTTVQPKKVPQRKEKSKPAVSPQRTERTIEIKMKKQQKSVSQTVEKSKPAISSEKTVTTINIPIKKQQNTEQQVKEKNKTAVPSEKEVKITDISMKVQQKSVPQKKEKSKPALPSDKTVRVTDVSMKKQENSLQQMKEKSKIAVPSKKEVKTSDISVELQQKTVPQAKEKSKPALPSEKTVTTDICKKMQQKSATQSKEKCKPSLSSEKAAKTSELAMKRQVSVQQSSEPKGQHDSKLIKTKKITIKQSTDKEEDRKLTYASIVKKSKATHTPIVQIPPRVQTVETKSKTEPMPLAVKLKVPLKKRTVKTTEEDSKSQDRDDHHMAKHISSIKNKDNDDSKETKQKIPISKACHKHSTLEESDAHILTKYSPPEQNNDTDESVVMRDTSTTSQEHSDDHNVAKCSSREHEKDTDESVVMRDTSTTSQEHSDDHNVAKCSSPEHEKDTDESVVMKDTSTTSQEHSDVHNLAKYSPQEQDEDTDESVVIKDTSTTSQEHSDDHNVAKYSPQDQDEDTDESVEIKDTSTTSQEHSDDHNVAKYSPQEQDEDTDESVEIKDTLTTSQEHSDDHNLAKYSPPEQDEDTDESVVMKDTSTTSQEHSDEHNLAK